MIPTDRPVGVFWYKGVAPKEIGYSKLIFPDGQPHITLDEEVKDSEVVIKASITSPDSLFDVLMLEDVLAAGDNTVHLYIDYLMGGRMDRPISTEDSVELAIVTRVLKTCKFETIAILDPHSRASTRLLGAAHDYPYFKAGEVLSDCDPATTVIIAPDKGATERVVRMTDDSGFQIVHCSKHRDPKTGKLSDPTIEDDPALVDGKRCVIFDDICDGGRTFTNLAKVLREAGAISVDLFVTHGIFSKGRELEGIDTIYSTDSYRTDDASPSFTPITRG